ncbi:MAG: GH92 family glycosyl hydrolase [Streptosporangiales bacterium]|nr:GH92 family glycosyl hydrolase [Streptosporangiales bacterium]
MAASRSLSRRVIIAIVVVCAAAICVPAVWSASSGPGGRPASARLDGATGIDAAQDGAVPGASTADFTRDVDPFVGSSAGGDTFPGATLPFGMAQPSPDTTSKPAGGGYAYSDKKILGFSAVHVSGPGCPSLGHVSLMPVTGKVRSTSAAGYASSFSHRTETARPGYYAVSLLRYGTKAEMTATERTAWERFTFPRRARTQRQVLLNLGAAQDKTSAANLTIAGPDTVTGSQSTGVFCDPGYRPVTVYFAARFSRPFAATGTWNNGPVNWRGGKSARGTAIGAALRFAGGARQVTARIGVSYTSAADAAANLAAETPHGGGFDAVRARAHRTWRQWLDRIAATGATARQRVTFYTALYHSLIEPNVFSDDNGRYLGMDGKIHTASGRAEYTNLSLWDTYRTQAELLDLIAPDIARDIILSLVSDTRELGWVPRWVLANTETNTMSGDSVTEMFADALAAGIVTPAEVRPVYPYLKKNATEAAPPATHEDGRQGIASYRARGYVPYDPSSQQYFLKSGASATLEYALADCGLSHIAGTLGHQGDEKDFAASAHNYRSEFDPSTRTFRPRRPDGSFLKPFSPSFLSLPYVPADARGYDEGSALQYRWLVPQDTSDLARLLGGRSAAVGDLDRLFDFGRVAARPGDAAGAWTGGGRYDPGNEPDLQAPYTYDALGAPWRTQAVVRAARTVYRPAPGGLPGNDDLGETSAWYVMSAVGLYPYAPGQETYALTTPLFRRAVVALPGPRSRGRPLVITTDGGGGYVRGLTQDGRGVGTAWLGRPALAGGGTLAYRTQAGPDRSWGAGPSAAPADYCGG